MYFWVCSMHPLIVNEIISKENHTNVILYANAISDWTSDIGDLASYFSIYQLLI